MQVKKINKKIMVPQTPNLRQDFQLFDEDLDFLENQDPSELDHSDSSFKKEESFFTDKQPENTDYLTKNNSLTLYVDSEFEDTIPLSFQVYCEGYFLNPNKKNHRIKISFSFIVVNKNYQSYFSKELLIDFEKQYNTKVFFDDLSQDKCFIFDYVLKILYLNYPHISDNFNPETNKFDVAYYFYFSPKDINIPFSNSLIRKFYLKKSHTLTQNRSITGSILIDTTTYSSYFSQFNSVFSFYIRFKDLSGLDKGGLNALSQSYELLFKKNELLNPYKAKMSEGIKDLPFQFLEYGYKDAYILKSIISSVLKSFNEILTNVFNITQGLYTISSIPMTIGSLVHTMYLKYLNQIIFKNNIYLKLAIYSRGILNPLAKNSDVLLKAYRLLKTKKSLKALENSTPQELDLLSNLISQKDAFSFVPWQFCSMKYIQSSSTLPSLLNLSKVSGARCNNEKPNLVFTETAADIDICSAYGSILENLSLTIGKPHYFSPDPTTDKPITLAKFLRNNKKNLKKGFWKLSVTGKLTFDQNLIYSRLVSSKAFKNIDKTIDPNDPDSIIDTGDFVLLRREIVEGVITPQILEVLQKSCTNQELGEFYSLKVNAALYYLDSDKVETIEELAEIYLADSEVPKFKSEVMGLVDKRSTAWFAAPFASFIGELIKRRKDLKKLNINLSLQNSYKLVVNTFYGILVSKYFSVNNCLIGDLITSYIRVNVWLLCIPLDFHFSVCDGGLSTLQSVLYLKEDSVRGIPGMDQLSNLHDPKNSNRFDFSPLAGIDWQKEFENLKGPEIKDIIAGLAKKHAYSFWKKYYNLTLNFDIEVKNIVKTASYISKAHYYFLVRDFNTNEWVEFFKIRGFHYDEGQLYPNPIFLLLKDMCLKGHLKDFWEKPWPIPNDGVYTIRKILRLRSWLLDSKLKESDLLPGDCVYDQRTFRLSNAYFPHSTQQTYESKRRQVNRTKYIDGQKTINLLFERFLSISLKRTLEAMRANQLGKLQEPNK